MYFILLLFNIMAKIKELTKVSTLHPSEFADPITTCLYSACNSRSRPYVLFQLKDGATLACGNR